ncbi:MAG: AAA family ATPase [Negativicutes bacterium]
MARIIAVANQKGGVGKTTTAVNLSACLALLGKKILLVDIDPQGNSTSGVGVEKHKIKECIYDVLVGEGDRGLLDNVLMQTQVENLMLLPATIQLAGADIELVSLMARETRLKRALDSLRDQFDYIIIDCPPSLSLLTVNAFTAADSVLIPIQCEFYALEGLAQLLRTITMIKSNLNSTLAVEGVLMTMYDARTNLSAQVVEEVRSIKDHRVFATVIPRSVRLSEAPSFGQPIALYDAKSRGSEVYFELAKELLKG